MADPSGKPTIVVRGGNILQPPLLTTTEAKTIEFRDGYGELIALLVRVFGASEMWGLVTKEDADWTETLIRHGYLDVTQAPDNILSSQ